MPNWKKVITSGSDASLNSLIVANGITGSLQGTASYAITASYALNSPGGGGSTNTGSLLTTASFSDPTITFTKGDGTTFGVDLTTLQPLTASYAVTASYVDSITLINPIVQYFDTTASIAAGTIMTLPGGLTFISSSQFEFIEVFINGLRLRYDVDFIPITTASIQYQLAIPIGAEIIYKSLYR